MTTSKRLAYLVSEYPAANHTYILREIRGLRNLGFEIKVASVRTDSRKISQLTREECEELSRTWYVKAQGVGAALRAHFGELTTRPRAYLRGLRSALGLGGTLMWNCFYFTEALLVGQWMRREALSHAHIHFASTVGMLILKTFPVTNSVTIHGAAEFQDPERFHLREKVDASTFTVAISNYGRDQLIRLCGAGQLGKIETVPLGVDTDGFRPSQRVSDQRSMLEVISVGRLAPEKAHGVLIQAIARLVSEGGRVRLRLVGEGPNREALERQISALGMTDAIKLLGALNQDRLKTLYRESDVFVLSSVAEGLPVVLMEAMSMEIPCVATRVGGTTELIEDEVDGLLVAPSDAGQIYAAIKRLIGDPELRMRIGVAGRQKVITQYDLAKNIVRLAKVFEKRIPNIHG